MLANASRSFIRSRLAVTSQVTSPLNVSWVPHDDHESLSEIYRLRYKVMVSDAAKSKKGNPFAPDHYCLHEGRGGMEFRDEYDDLPSTGHCLVRFNGVPVASTRIVDGNHTPLEAEKVSTECYILIPEDNKRETLVEQDKEPPNRHKPLTQTPQTSNNKHITVRLDRHQVPHSPSRHQP